MINLHGFEFICVTVSYSPGHAGPLSLAIPSWINAMSTGDGFGQLRGRNGESCVAVGYAYTTAGILSEVG